MPLSIEMRIAHYKDDVAPSATLVSCSKKLDSAGDEQEVSDEFSLMAQDLLMKFKRFIAKPADVDIALLKAPGHTVDIFGLRSLLNLMESGKLVGDITVVQPGPDRRTIIFDLRKPPSTT